MTAPDLHGFARAAGVNPPDNFGHLYQTAELYQRTLNAISAAHTAGFNAGYAAALASISTPSLGATIEKPPTPASPSETEL